tara:strand:- start:1217 stop:1657 length:441 start_codon:yes stop_codon:yes gene_type:complete
MARITVEDCIDKFPSRFELVLVASNRARKLHSGEETELEKNNDKNTVIALREISEEKISIDDLKNSLIEEYQTVSFSDEIDESTENSYENEINEDSNEIDSNKEIESIADEEKDTNKVLEETEDETKIESEMKNTDSENTNDNLNY